MTCLYYLLEIQQRIACIFLLKSKMRNSVKFHSDPRSNDGPWVVLKSVALHYNNKNSNNDNKISSDWGAVLGPKTF